MVDRPKDRHIGLSSGRIGFDLDYDMNLLHSDGDFNELMRRLTDRARTQTERRMDRLIIESTPSSTSNSFYEMFKNAGLFGQSNGWEQTFLPWSQETEPAEIELRMVEDNYPRYELNKEMAFECLPPVGEADQSQS